MSLFKHSFSTHSEARISIRSSHKKLRSKAVGFRTVTRRDRKLSHWRLSDFV